MSFHGIIPPLATPFKDNEDLDIERLKWFIEQQIEAGVHGIFVLGTNSEFYAMDEAEKQQVIAVAVEQVRKRVPVFAGTGAETTREAERLTKMAQKEGVDGVSVITPYFILPNQNEIHDHYKRIAESTNLPVLLYSNPVTCGGLKIDPDTCGRLAKIKNIVGIKDSSGDLQGPMGRPSSLRADLTPPGAVPRVKAIRRGCSLACAALDPSISPFLNFS